MKLHPRLTHIEDTYLAAKRTEERKQECQLHIPVKRVTSILLVITLLLFCCHLATLGIVYQDDSGSSFMKYLEMYFNFNYENNFPSFFSSLLLLFSSVLLGFIYKLTERHNKHRRRWLLLSLIFLFLSLDEALKIHERIGTFTNLIFTNDMEGYLTWTWIIPYTVLFLVVAVYNFSFVMQLARPIRNKFLLAGGLFVFAAAGIESIEGHLMKITAEDPDILMVTTTSQELIEMVSVILFISALLTYLKQKFAKIRLTWL